MQEYSFIIPLPPITKKNHSRIIVRNGKPLLIPSEAYKKYEDECGWYVKLKGEKISSPLTVRCLFYMPTKRRVDLPNLLNAIDDILVHYDVIEDDNSNIIASHDGSRVLYDKKNPRTEVFLSNYNSYCEFCSPESMEPKSNFCPNCGRKL